MRNIKTAFVILTLSLGLSCIVNAKPQKGEHRHPPKEAVEACVDKSEGDSVSFTTPRGDDVTGICTTMEEQLVAVPEDHAERKQKR